MQVKILIPFFVFVMAMSINHSNVTQFVDSINNMEFTESNSNVPQTYSCIILGLFDLLFGHGK